MNAATGVKIAYMFVTYLLWGSVFYTAINIPYGSMAAVLSDNQKHRSSLSVFRSMGSVFATIIISVIAPLMVYYTDQEGNQVVHSGRFTAVAGLFSLLALLFYFLCFAMTTERVKVDPQPRNQAPAPGDLKKPGFWQSLAGIFTNRAFVGMILSALVMLFATLMSQGINNFLFADYFRNAKALSIFSLISIPAMLLLAGVSIPLCAKFGKKEVVIISCALSGLLYFAIGLAKFENGYSSWPPLSPCWASSASACRPTPWSPTSSTTRRCATAPATTASFTACIPLPGKSARPSPAA